MKPSEQKPGDKTRAGRTLDFTFDELGSLRQRRKCLLCSLDLHWLEEGRPEPLKPGTHSAVRRPWQSLSSHYQWLK